LERSPEVSASFSTIYLITFLSASSANIRVMSKLVAFASVVRNEATHFASSPVEKDCPSIVLKMPERISAGTSVFLKYDSSVASGMFFRYLRRVGWSFLRALKSFSKPAAVLGT